MANYVKLLDALETLGFSLFRQRFVDSRNKKLYFTFTYSPEYGTIAIIGFPSPSKSQVHVVEYYKLG